MRKLLIAALVAACAVGAAGPAMADHNPAHSDASCGDVPPVDPNNTTLGHEIYTEDSNIGASSGDNYVFVDADPNDGDGVAVYAYQPYYDDGSSGGLIKGPMWIAVGVDSDSGACQNSKPPTIP